MASQPLPRIVIAMPTSGMVRTGTVSSLFEAVAHLASMGAQIGYRTVESSDLVRSRNYLASLALHQKATHILFVDSDMTFTPKLVMRMFDSGAPFIGAIYPRRKIDLENLIKLTRDAPADAPPSVLVSRALDYVVRWPLGVRQAKITNGLCKVLGLGMGLTLVKAEVLQTMIDKNVVDPGAGNFPMAEFPTWGFFNHRDDGKGDVLSEDLSFCARWVEDCGGEILGIATHDIGHIGELIHRGSVLDRHLTDEERFARRPEAANPGSVLEAVSGPAAPDEDG